MTLDCLDNDLDLAPYFIERGSDVNVLNYHGGSALLNACANGKIDTVNLLLKKGARVDVDVDTSSNSPLSEACMKNHTECVKGKSL